MQKPIKQRHIQNTDVDTALPLQMHTHSQSFHNSIKLSALVYHDSSGQDKLTIKSGTYLEVRDNTNVL